MKKLFVLLLVLLVVMTFVACGSQENIRGEQKVEGSSSNEGVSNIESDDEVNSDEEFSLGSVNGLTYENKFIGLGCSLDSEWTFYTDEQIKDLNNITLDAVGEEVEEIIKASDIVYDMYTSRNNGLDSINVNLEKVNPVQLALINLEDYYLNAAPTLVKGLENMGLSNITYETGTITIDGQEFDCLNVEADIQGINFYETLFSVKCNGYLANISIGNTGENNIDDIIESFYLTK